eukprot:365017-Chlamydomonas_euryale.AAC.8
MGCVVEVTLAASLTDCVAIAPGCTLLKHIAASTAAITAAQVEAKRAQLAAAYATDARVATGRAVATKPAMAAEANGTSTPPVKVTGPAAAGAVAVAPRPPSRVKVPDAPVLMQQASADGGGDGGGNNGGSDESPSRMQRIMDHVGSILGMLDKEEQQQKLKEATLAAAAAAPQSHASAADVSAAAAAAALTVDRASPPGSPHAAANRSTWPAAPTPPWYQEDAQQPQQPSPWEGAPKPAALAAAAAPAAATSKPAAATSKPAAATSKPSAAPPMPAARTPPAKRAPALQTEPTRARTTPPSATSARPLVPTLLPDLAHKPAAPRVLATTAGMATIEIKCRMLDVVYGTQRGVSASLDERGEVEELVAALEARNPNTLVTDAVNVRSGRTLPVDPRNRVFVACFFTAKSVVDAVGRQKRREGVCRSDMGWGDIPLPLRHGLGGHTFAAQTWVGGHTFAAQTWVGGTYLCLGMSSVGAWQVRAHNEIVPPMCARALWASAWSLQLPQSAPLHCMKVATRNATPSSNT